MLLGVAVMGMQPELSPVRIQNPHLGCAVSQIRFHFACDLVRGVAFGDNLYRQRGRAKVVVPNRLAGMGDTHVRLQPTAVLEQIAHLVVYFTQRTDTGIRQNLPQAQVHPLGDLVVSLLGWRQLYQLPPEQLTFARMIGQALKLGKLHVLADSAQRGAHVSSIADRASRMNLLSPSRTTWLCVWYIPVLSNAAMNLSNTVPMGGKRR